MGRALGKEKAMINRLRLIGGIALAVLASGSVISGQEKQPAPGDVIIYKAEQEKMLGHPHPMPPGGDSFFFASEMSFGGKLVKGAPYSAEAITEHTQTLSDGNRIVNKSTAAVYRDTEGRSRSEHTFRPPFAIEGAPWRTVHISDPVAAVSYVLHPGIQVARKMPPMRFKSEFKGSPTKAGADVQEHFEMKIHSDGGPDPAIDETITTIGVAVNRLRGKNRNSRTESLGKQNIGGVEAEGVRTTVTIPAGEIGNERPIETVSERWYSPELQIVVMTKHIDPRSGENVYRLTNIDRSEPARSLFEVPAGYRIEGPGPVQKMRVRKPADEQ
jgi:hypothetical protein